MNVLANGNELLKYIEIWNNVEALFNGVALNKKFDKKGFHSGLAHNNKYIRTRTSSYDENFHDSKKLTKHKYCGHLILLLLESICEVENKYYPQTFLHKFFE